MVWKLSGFPGLACLIKLDVLGSIKYHSVFFVQSIDCVVFHFSNSYFITFNKNSKAFCLKSVFVQSVFF